jgi:hypothetical protein
MEKQDNSASEALKAFENEKMDRRRALGRIGFLAGAAAVAALTSDELLRKVGDRLAQNAGDNQVAQQVAKEFQAAGMAFAVPFCSGCMSNCVATATHKCINCDVPCLPQRLIKYSCGECDTNYNGLYTYCLSLDSDHSPQCLKDIAIAWCKCRKSGACPGSGGLPAQCSDCPTFGICNPS